MDEKELQNRLADAENRALEAESNMVQAARLGQQLLERNTHLESQFSELNHNLSEMEQERHSLTRKLDSESALLLSTTSELEALRSENSKLTTDKNSEINVLKNKCRELESALLENKNIEESHYLSIIDSLKDKIKLYEFNKTKVMKEEAELSSNHNDSNGSHKMTLNDEIMEDKEKLEAELTKLKECNDFQCQKISRLEVENAELSSDLREKEIKLASYCRSLEAARANACELNMEMETLKFREVDSSAKGNSLFSEVEDRRHFVEQKLSKLNDKNTELTELYNDKTKECSRIKMLNYSLLNKLANAESKSNCNIQIIRLEDQLNLLRNQNKILQKQLEESFSVSSETILKKNENEGTEYQMYSVLLEEKTKNMEDLKSRIQDLIQQSLLESDKVRELSRKLDGAELLISQQKAENYHLKIELDEIKNQVMGKTSSISHNTIFEDIKFETSPVKENFQESPKSIDEKVKDENSVLPLTQSKPTKSVKKVCYSSNVEIIPDDSMTSKSKSSRVKRHVAISANQEDESTQNECNQQ